MIIGLPTQALHQRTWSRRYTLNRIAVLLFSVLSVVATLRAAEPDIAITNPYEGASWEESNRHKASLHIHTEMSDGELPPHRAIDTYRSLGFTVLALTDHKKVTYPWTSLSKMHEGFEDRDPGKLGMAAIQGTEMSQHHHMLSLWSDYEGSKKVEESLEATKERNSQVIICHPGRYKMSVSWYVDIFKTYDHIVGLGIYNQGDRFENDRET